MIETTIKNLSCPSCGKMTLEKRVVPDLETRLARISFRMPTATFFECNQCGEKIVSASELESRRKVLVGQLLAEGHIPSKKRIREIREKLGLSLSQWSAMLHITEVRAKALESNKTPDLPPGPDALLIMLIGLEADGQMQCVSHALLEFQRRRGETVRPEDTDALPM